MAIMVCIMTTYRIIRRYTYIVVVIVSDLATIKTIVFTNYRVGIK